MKINTSVILQVLIMLLGLAVLILMIRLPQTEGRAKDLDLVHIYADPLILYGYVASIPFFIGLYKFYRLLGYIGQGRIYSTDSVNALSMIKFCALLLATLIIGAAVFIKLNHSKEDDPAGFLAVCMISIIGSVLVAIAAGRYENRLKKRITADSKK